MNPLELIQQKRQHLVRLANQQGAAGEAYALSTMTSWVARPKGIALKNLLQALREKGIEVKGSSFDFIEISDGVTVNFSDPTSIRAAIENMIFIELKTSNQARVKPGFTGFFFALSESEITAAELLGNRHKVVLYNNLTQETFVTSVGALLSRAKSSTWQLSIQL